MELNKSICDVKRRIKLACEECGRAYEDITLIAASKMQDVKAIEGARDSGIEIFGENRVQELVEKYPYIKDVKWHLIGHLQKNKVKYIVDKVEMIHSVDSVELAQEIDKRSAMINKIMPILLQINIGREATKSGIDPNDIYEVCSQVSAFKNIEIEGLMAIPPKGSEEEVAGYFRSMKSIYDRVKKLDYNNFNIKYLSMGMTGDFEIAIKEGSNMIRVGTGIFGERDYSRR